MRHTSKRKTRRTIGIRGQLLWFLCFICLLLLLLFWFLSTRLLEPLYTTHIQKQLTAQADAIVERLDKAIAEGETLSYWGFGSQLYVNTTFFNELGSEIFENSGMSSFCVDISDTTLRQIFKIENLSYCNLHRTKPTDTGGEMLSYSTARAMRQLCRETGSCVRKINPPTPSGSVQLMVGKTTSDGSYTVLVTTSLMHVAEAGRVMSTVLPLAAALIFAFSMSAAWLFSEWFTKPLRELSGAARQVAQGNYNVQVDSKRNDELGDLAQDFNHMAQEVQHASQMQRDLLANVSHDLRTPLTLIKGYAETVRDITGDDKAHRNEQMNIIVDEADRLTALVSSVMELSKVTSGAIQCERVHFDMGQLCDEVSERYDAVCAQNGWELKLELPEEELPVYADPDMMQRALHNLLGNAMHHIGEDGLFFLRAFKCPEGVRVEVEDHGPGISAEDLPYIFDRYYRSRSDAGKQGTGLGLSITKAIFQQHGFRFGVQSAAACPALATDFLRGECGMKGFVITDAYQDMDGSQNIDPYYEQVYGTLVGGSDLPDGSTPATQGHFDKFKTGYSAMAWAMRQSAKRICYQTVWSSAMNGISSNTRVVSLTPWWQKALYTADIVLSLLFAASLIWTLYALIQEERKTVKKAQK